MYKFYRIDCNLVYKKRMKVEHRLLCELAQSREEAESKVRAYMESYSDYIEIVFNDVHEETEDEKYGSKVLWNGYNPEENKTEQTKPVEEKPVVGFDGELF